MKLKFAIALMFLSLFSFGQINDYEKINSLYKEGKLQETIVKSTIALSKFPPSDTIYTKLLELRAISFMDISNFRQAISDYQQLIQLHPKNGDYYGNIFYAYCEIGENSIGYSYLKQGNEINPSDLLILNNMSYYLGQIKRYTESIKYANIGLDQKKASDIMISCLLNNRGYAFVGLNQCDRGILDINKSIEHDPNNSYSYYYRALANICLRQMTTVCADLEKSKSLRAVKLTQDLIIENCSK